MPPRTASTLLAVAALLAALPPAAQAHSVFEAAELEVHLLNDEGSDFIEPYGGYDIQEVFAGFAHDPQVGAGPAGDGFYLRAELYGDRAESTVPAGGARWSVTFLMDVDGTPLERTLSTTDGAAFESDFDALLVEVEERDTHVQRAFVSFEKAGLAPGQALTVLRVESRVDGDLRDYAPGGIPVPGTDGAADWEDPTAIEGSGVVTESVPLRRPDNYLTFTLGAQPGGHYNVTVRSALAEGGQHAILDVRSEAGWSYTLNETSKALEANGTFTFGLAADSTNATGPLVLDVLTDVGGRSELWLDLNGTLHAPNGASVTSEPLPRKESPGPALPLVLAALAVTAVVGRRRN